VPKSMGVGYTFKRDSALAIGRYVKESFHTCESVSFAKEPYKRDNTLQK